ncbi:MAG: DUF1573 domain-containing protein [Chitinophagales bacterium]|nr:DUF1573 domain-containing protein [Chitinophagales bacterium]
MKKEIFLSFLFALAGIFTFAQNGAQISFQEDTHNFGEVSEGPKVSYEFNFTNTGTEPLVLSNVKASCGCTTPSWPKEPILPGENGTILVTYNTSNRVGKFNKTITITSNAEEATKVLKINGEVMAAPVEETMPVKAPMMMAPSSN